MEITVTPTGATLGAHVTGVVLRSIDDEQWHEIEAAWHEHGVLVFPGQHLTHDEQVEFSTRVGTLERLAEAKTERGASTSRGSPTSRPRAWSCPTRAHPTSA